MIAVLFVYFILFFLGYPAPQVTWYKDDMQLDRYCGLPKYEIFRNGQNHSLHIYKYVYLKMLFDDVHKGDNKENSNNSFAI